MTLPALPHDAQPLRGDRNRRASATDERAREARRRLSAGEDGTVKLWDAESGRLLSTLPGHTGGVWSVALSRDGEVVASGSFDGLVRLWAPETGRLLATLQGHAGAVWSVALSGDRRLVASGGFDGTLRLWEASTGAWLRTLRADRPYERMDITGLTGVTAAQREALVALGALERASPDETSSSGASIFP